MLVILSPSSTTKVWITKIVVGGKDEDIDGNGDDEDDKKDNAGHLIPVEYHKGLSRKDGDECDGEIRI